MKSCRFLFTQVFCPRVLYKERVEYFQNDDYGLFIEYV